MQKTNEKRDIIIVVSLFIFFGALLISSTYIAVKGAETDKKIWKKIVEFFSPPPKTEEHFVTKPKIDYQENPTVTPRPTRSIPIPTSIKYSPPTQTVNYPTFPPLPTIRPGAPGSKEWQAEFNRKWEESKKRYEDGLRDLCEKIPSASVCK